MPALKFLVIFLLASSSFAQHVRIEVLDRGQADGIVIRTPNHKWLVIDAGTNKQQADLLTARNVEDIELAVVSHRHFDHQGGMDEILKAIPVKKFVGITQDCPDRASDDTVRDQLSAHNTK